MKVTAFGEVEALIGMLPVVVAKFITEFQEVGLVASRGEAGKPVAEPRWWQERAGWQRRAVSCEVIARC